MQIVFLRSNPVAPDSRVEKEANTLLKAGFQVTILAWDRQSKYYIRKSTLRLRSGEVDIHRFGIPATFGGGIKRNFFPLLIFQIRLYKWLQKNKDSYDVIHACDFDTAYLAMKTARHFKKKLVYDIFDYYTDAFNVPGFLKNFVEKKEHKVINFADATIICSEQRQEQIRGTKPQKLVIIHNTPEQLDINDNPTPDNLVSSIIKIAYVGVLVEGRLIRELITVVKDNPKYELHIGGFGQLEGYIAEMAERYSNIIYYGRLPYQKTLELENSCDLMTAIYDPSVANHRYAAPNKFYEAIMLGKPLIMVKNTGMWEFVKRYDIGEVIEYNLESLKSGICSLVTRRSEWPTMAIKMKELYQKMFDWSEMEKRLVGLYNDLEKIS